jgi:hypothetical protein
MRFGGDWGEIEGRYTMVVPIPTSNLFPISTSDLFPISTSDLFPISTFDLFWCAIRTFVCILYLTSSCICLELFPSGAINRSA